MNLVKPMCVLDVEATGLEISTARVVQLSITKIYPSAIDLREHKTWMFNPGFPMDQDVIEIHGITDEMVKDAPPFNDKAGEVLKFIESCDLGGFNLKNFDVPLLWEEFNRSDIQWDLTGIAIVDAGSIFKAHGAHLGSCGEVLLRSRAPERA